MSLILAVEPDRKQAKQLSTVVKHVRAEFVVADSGAAALAALGDRVPDLILTPALLPPKDEAVLTGWLRDLGDAAAHVQTLAIPILAEPGAKKNEQPGSIFGRLRDQGQGDSGPGCDPNVFAEQIRVYLDRAGNERSTRVVEEPMPEVEVPVAAAPEESAPEIDEFEETVTFDDLVFDPGPNDPAPAPTPVPVSEPPVVMRTPTPFARPEKRIEPAVLRSWEAELGLESSPASAPPLWRARTDQSEAAGAPGAGLAFDPTDARYAPLFQRLDQLASMNAAL